MNVFLLNLPIFLSCEFFFSFPSNELCRGEEINLGGGGGGVEIKWGDISMYVTCKSSCPMQKDTCVSTYKI